MAHLAARFARSLQIRLHQLLDHAYDRSLGLESRRAYSLAELSLRGPNAAHAAKYEPSPFRLAQRFVESLDVDFRRFVFVDFGSGKGRILLLAARKPFLRVEGVEFSEHRHQTALSNIARTLGTQRQLAPIVTRHMDAVEYDFPREPLCSIFSTPSTKP